VTSGLPEEGKSTVAHSLAATSAAGGKRALLVECDLRRPIVATRLGIASQPGLSDVLAGGVKFTDVVQTLALQTPGATVNGGRPPRDEESWLKTLDCVTAGSPSAEPAELLSSDRMREFLREATSAYDVVVLDSSPLLPVADTLGLLSEVDVAVVCVRPSSTTRHEARATRSALHRFPSRPMGLVVTGVRRRDEEYGYHSYGYSYSDKNS
jgi:Mrp family chromosome partitioning ATPase